MYKLVISHALPLIVFEIRTESNGSKLSTLVLSVEFPPEFSRKYDDRRSHRKDSTRWNEQDAWYRSVDILFDAELAKALPASLSNTRSLVNLGRWTTYKLDFDLETNDKESYSQFLEALHDFNITIKRCADFKFLRERTPSVFQYIDQSRSPKSVFRSFADELLDDGICHLPFDVRYQLEVCISEGCLDQYNLSKEFVEGLNAMVPERAKQLLVEVAIRKKRVFDPMSIFENVRLRKPRRKVPEYAFYAHTAIVTPTTIYFGTPSIEISNRVVRRFKEHADRFLRVRFTDERPRGNIYGTDKDTLNEIFTRVKRVLMNGIVIGDRYYVFLAFGNSQFRENGAYFFCPLPHLSAAKIRNWMGNFQDIKIVAKYAARLGQCFSTTRAIHGAKVTIRELEDIYTEDRKFIFTDGVGIISKFLAQVAASEIGALTAGGEPPSAMQFRLGGCKGVLVVWPLANKREIYIRKSQHKFDADHEGLEIIRWSQFSAANLNRQLITILTTLGVPDEVFTEKLDAQLQELSDAIKDPSTAVRALQRDIDPNQMTLEVAEMVRHRFQAAQEPFMMSILHLWRAFSIKYLKEKAKIAIHDGAILLGCVDESSKLQGHREHVQAHRSQTGTQKDPDDLPQIFIQLSGSGPNGLRKPRILQGLVVLARNPSLHPGDLRVVKAVDVPELHHLMDVVVLPKTGDRDLAGMCSGGDLDGDDFLVLWDKDLIPSEWNAETMDYTPPPPLTVQHDITVDDLTSFFVQYMKNDTLGNIANAWIAMADDAPAGAKDARCIELAQLHSKAVDYAKSGYAAVMPQRLKPKQWPHFMERRGSVYHSRTALGKLYDRIELVDFVPSYELPFDRRILEAFSPDLEALAAAAYIKEEYDADVCRIMAQHAIATEFEVWSTFVLKHAHKNDFKFHEEIGRLSTTLKDTFRNQCYTHIGGREFEKLAPFVAAMYTVTHRQVTSALKDLAKPCTPKGAEMTKQMPLISFPWLFPAILGEIATGRVKERSNQVGLFNREKHLESARRSMEQQSVKAAKETEEDVLSTQAGLKRRGDVLSLFSDKTTEVSHAEDVIQFNNPSASDVRDRITISSPEVRSASSRLGSTRDQMTEPAANGDDKAPEDTSVDESDETSTELEDREEVMVSIPSKPSLLGKLAELNDTSA